MNSTTDIFLDKKTIAEILHISIKTIDTWMTRKQMPEPDIRSNRFTRWKKSNITDFLDNPIEWRNKNKP